MTPGDVTFLCLAGVLAGMVGTAGAITSLVAYPALLLVGLAPRSAGIVNVVAVSATWPSSARASRPELAGQGPWLRAHLPFALAGGALGMGLLILTPPGAFTRIVPFLVATGSLALLGAGRTTPRRHLRAGHRSPLLGVGIFMISTYNGYFGAGAGVMLLALCLLVRDVSLPVANACKNMLVGVANAVSAAGLVLFADVRWGAALPLAVGAFLGGALGPAVARRVPERGLRYAVATFGLAVAVQMFLAHGR